MKKSFFAILITILFSNLYAQKYTINGYVEDALSGERLIGAIVYVSDNEKYSTITNEFGYFSLKVPTNETTIKVAYVGYQNFEEKIKFKTDTTLIIKLNLKNEIQEVVVTAQKQEVQSTQMSKIQVPIKLIQSLPVIFGEVDLMKSLQLLPGVQSGMEGTSGIYVRGGGPDQNLILLDGVPIYNANHLFGFFSVFNTDAIKDVTLIKGGFPAHYGGRLSSVIDVRMKDGNMKKYTGSLSVGVISSKFTYEGPIKKDKSSFIISARRTYIDLFTVPLMKLFGSMGEQNENSSWKSDFLAGYYFYDLNVKLNYKITDKDRIYLSFYSGRDKAYVKTNDYYEYFDHPDSVYKDYENSKFILAWGNLITALRWNHSFKKNLFVNTTLTYSKFDFLIEGEFSSESYKPFQDKPYYRDEFRVGYNSGIDDWALNVDFYYNPNVNLKTRFGLSSIYHTFRPGMVNLYMYVYDEDYGGETMNVDTSFGSSYLYAPEFAFYLENDINITSWLKINLGTRFSTMLVRDTVFWSPEPRLAARFLITPNFSVKASYAKMKQYLHFLTNNTVGMPIDLWLPATDLVVPEESQQYAAGISWLIKRKYSLSIEGFYKKMDNLIELKEGETIFSKPGEEGMGEIWEQKVEQGQGWAYGAEFFIRKDIGKLKGWIAYTLSWSLRQFPNISFGKVFPYKYDRRHDLSIVLNYQFNDKIDLGITWVYGSGTPVTIPLGEYYPLDGTYASETYITDSKYITYLNGIKYFEERNNYRLPSYHRLDIGINFHKKKQKGIRTWSIGVYNAYNHVNPFYSEIYNRFDPETFTSKPVLRVYSIFPIMPSISYKFKWF